MNLFGRMIGVKRPHFTFAQIDTQPCEQAQGENACGPATDCYYFGHHKCATNWMRTFLKEVTELIGFNYVVQGGSQKDNVELSSRIHTFHLYVNSTPSDLAMMPDNARGFHLIRDPRDALISDYFSRMNSHSVDTTFKQELRQFLQSNSLEKGLVRMVDCCTYFQQVADWPVSNVPGVLDMRYEDLVQDQEGQFMRILKHLGISLPGRMLREVVDKSTFRSMSGGRERGQEDRCSHFRKGVAGDWTTYMPPGGLAYEVFMNRYAGLLKHLGYA